MDTAWLTILGTLIGACAGISGGLLAACMQARVEREKWQRAREDSAERELRGNVQQLTVHLTAAIWAMLWLTWHARNARDHLTRDQLDGYDREIQRLAPQIIGLQAVVAAGINPGLFQTLSELVDRVLYRLDVEIATAKLEFKPGEPATGEALSRCYDEAFNAYRALPKDTLPLLTAAPRAACCGPDA